MPVLERKLQIPEADATALIPLAAAERLERARDFSLVLAHAPAGFGKTTLLARWVRQLESPAAWLALDRRDARPLRFARGLVAALRRLVPTADAQWQNLLETSESSDVEFLLDAIEGQAELLPAETVLVLDDVHLLSAESLEMLTLWLDNLPPGLTLILGARQLPEALPLARWRLQQRVLEISSDQLRWSGAEIGGFFASFRLTAEQLERIGEQSHGWALACQLLKLQLAQQVPADDAIAQLGRHRLLEDYLQQEVLPFLPAEAFRFLVETAILADLNPQSCRALVPQGPSLAELARRLPFLSLIDRERDWYVCHPLLRDWLQQQLNAARKAELHALAADYFLTAGAHELALEHAQQAGDEQVLARTLEVLAQTLLGLGRIQTLQQAFEALSEHALRSRPVLAMFQIWIWLLTGDLAAAETWIAWLEAQPAEVLPERDGQIANLRGTLQRRTGQHEAMIAYSRQALASESRDPFIPACAWFNLGLALMQQEKWTEAEEAFHHAARWNRLAGNLITHFAARVCQARLYLRQGELDTARRAYADILASGRQEALHRHSLFGVVQIDQARIAYELDEMSLCRQSLQEGLSLTRMAYNLDSVYGFVQAARILLDARELTAADTLLHDAMQFAQTRHLQSLWQNLQLLRERLDIFQGKLFKAGSGDAWNGLYAALAGRDSARAEIELAPLLEAHREHRLERVRLEMLKARLLELKGESIAARQQVLQALEVAQRAPTFRSLIDEADPVLLAWMPSLLAGLKPGFRARLLAVLAERGFQSEAEALSERERELLQCLADGLTNKQLEDKLFISQNTIKTHLKNLYRKLGVGSRTAAIAKAREQGWL